MFMLLNIEPFSTLYQENLQLSANKRIVASNTYKTVTAATFYCLSVFVI